MKLLFVFVSVLLLLHGADTMKAFNETKAACEAGKGAACTRMYYYYVPTKYTYVPGITLDLHKALYYAQKACDFNDEEGCFSAGMILYYGDDWEKIARDETRGKAYIQKACRLGKEDACSYFP